MFDLIPDAWQGPQAQLAMECHYRQVDISEDFQLLERTPNRCGAPVFAGRVTARAGQFVQLPTTPPNEALVASASIPTPRWWELEELVLRPHSAFCAGYGRGGLIGGARWLVGTTGDLHVLQPASDLGYTGNFSPLDNQYFEIGPEIPSGVYGCVTARTTQPPVTITYYRMPFH